MALQILVKNRDFGFLWLAQLISFIGDGMFQTALVWWLIQKTGSGTMVGLIMSVSFLPAVLIGPFAGTMADRVSPKLLLVGADLFRAVLVIIFAYLVHHDYLEIPYIFVFSCLLSTAGVFHSPTTLTVIPRVVPTGNLDEAMALHTIVRDISKLIGPALGGAIIAKVSSAAAFASHGLCLILSAGLVLLMKISEGQLVEHKESVMRQLLDGLKYVKNQRTLFEMLIGFGALNVFVVPIIVLVPMTIEKVFHLTSFEFGISEGALALGSVLTGLFFMKLFGGVQKSKLLVRVMGFSGLIFFWFALIPKIQYKLFPIIGNVEYSFFDVKYSLFFLLFLGGLLLLGGCFTAVNVAVLTLFQRKVAPEMKGRFFSLVEVLSYALFPVALAAAGVLSDNIGVPKCYAICAAGIFFLSIRYSMIPGLETLDSEGK